MGDAQVSGSLFALRALAAVRLVNGALGLAWPQLLARRLGVDPSKDPAPLYPLRLFGIRNIVLGLDLLLLTSDELERALRIAILIHASDTTAAALSGLRRELPRGASATTTLLSAGNTLLAFRALQSLPEACEGTARRRLPPGVS
jgi:hypothetical protein